MTLQTLQTVILHPLLWWLLSVAIAIWAVLATPTQALQGDIQKQYWADRFIILLLIFTAALFGGDLYVSLNDYITDDLDNIFSGSLLISGAKGTIGAMLGSVIVVFSYLIIRKIPVLVYADALVPFAALAYMIARIGCFTNGDDFGSLSNLPWSVSFGPYTQAYELHASRGWINQGAVETLQVHPTQLYHAAAGLFGFILLKTWQPDWQGSRFSFAFIYYGVTRFSIQFFRDDHWVGSRGFYGHGLDGHGLDGQITGGFIIDTTQWFSLLFIVFGFSLWLYHKVHLNREELILSR